MQLFHLLALTLSSVDCSFAQHLENADNVFTHEQQHRSLRASNGGNTNKKLTTRNLFDPKTVQSKGYICQKGSSDTNTLPFSSSSDVSDSSTSASTLLLSHLPSFLEAYHQRNQIFQNTIQGTYGLTNFGGNGLFHAFTLWTILRELKPTVIIESGVRNGYTSWLVAKATEEYGPIFVRVDPAEKGWDGIEGNPNWEKHVSFRGENAFQDIVDIDWEDVYAKHNLLPSSSPKETTLVILDDHQDQLRRLVELHNMGFKHVVIDDNYMPGVGDAFSIKDACDAMGGLRMAFTDGNVSPARCDCFHHTCKKYEMGDEAWKEFAAQLETVAQTYWEGPPLAPLEEPYGSLIEYIENMKSYEGPSTWTETHARLVVESTKEPLFPTLKEAAEATGFTEEFLASESGRYIHMAYIQLRGDSSSSSSEGGEVKIE